MAQPAVFFREIARDVRSLDDKTEERLLKIRSGSGRKKQTDLLNIRQLAVLRVV